MAAHGTAVLAQEPDQVAVDGYAYTMLGVAFAPALLVPDLSEPDPGGGGPAYPTSGVAWP